MDVKVWLDELDVNGLLAPHALLSMFERGRSDALGGPDRLEALMAEGFMFVVARLDGYPMPLWCVSR
ncbi:hypothetical protein Naga_102336g1 [Nannochloropsis gaditana]|uniref:Uncharacterized protein n=1 Tax=Nannochloropsis gaditana TaxID=72520 RepID=W7TTS1_9STRA|nr:hypothetical protein Naga_102336g1 [Nannochloropsis gaditana]